MVLEIKGYKDGQKHSLANVPEGIPTLRTVNLTGLKMPKSISGNNKTVYTKSPPKRKSGCVSAMSICHIIPPHPLLTTLRACVVYRRMQYQ